jgi:hypothetical protein
MDLKKLNYLFAALLAQSMSLCGKEPNYLVTLNATDSGKCRWLINQPRWKKTRWKAANRCWFALTRHGTKFPSKRARNISSPSPFSRLAAQRAA